MKRFEYTFIDLEDQEQGDFLEKLRAMGNEGWEACGFEYAGCFLKREIHPKAEDVERVLAGFQP